MEKKKPHKKIREVVDRGCSAKVTFPKGRSKADSPAKKG